VLIVSKEKVENTLQNTQLTGNQPLHGGKKPGISRERAENTRETPGKQAGASREKSQKPPKTFRSKQFELSLTLPVHFF